jgi:hypothetical protein
LVARCKLLPAATHPRPNFSSFPEPSLAAAVAAARGESKSAFGLFVLEIYGQGIYQSDALLGRSSRDNK